MYLIYSLTSFQSSIMHNLLYPFYKCKSICHYIVELPKGNTTRNVCTKYFLRVQ